MESGRQNIRSVPVIHQDPKKRPVTPLASQDQGGSLEDKDSMALHGPGHRRHANSWGFTYQEPPHGMNSGKFSQGRGSEWDAR